IEAVRAMGFTPEPPNPDQDWMSNEL
ncbi:MAG: hypothetical protein RI941_527, partial [Pseudomonadota bacterium]